MILLLTAAVWATPGFDPSAAEAVFTGAEGESLDGERRLWSAIERLADPDRTLFSGGEFNSASEWAEASEWAPHIGDCFGTSRPHSSLALLHAGPGAASAAGTPILFVPGAGDNASGGFSAMTAHFDVLSRPVYGITFAHPHGDVFQQAEALANAIARIRVLTGAARVDLVAHSKGGIAAAVYVSNAAGTDWGKDAYEAVGTRFRDDVRRAVFIGTPFGGLDTAFRWTNGNYLSLDWDEAFAPSAWGVYYPYGTGVAYSQSLAPQDFLPEGGDLFPGQRQLLARQPAHPLPLASPTLGAYALQTDGYTTYEGGLGFYSISPGIDAAIDAGGSVIDRLHRTGAAPSVELFLLAGTHPVLPNWALEDTADSFSGVWGELATASAATWSALLAGLVAEHLLGTTVTFAEAQALASGALILGEVSGESDGLVFVTSATDASALTARGAVVVRTKTVGVSHLDLLSASPSTGAALITASAADPDDAWMADLGTRYTEADTIGWVEAVLADGAGGDDTGEDAEDDSAGAADTGPADTGPADAGPAPDSDDPATGCHCRTASAGIGVWVAWVGALGLAWRRRVDRARRPPAVPTA